jgi:16S rRNA (cytosine1402-N4)-methyltransferase
MKDTVHESVLLHETIGGLGLERYVQAEQVTLIDGTTGGGGHSEAMLQAFEGSQTQVSLICYDLDEEAIARSTTRLAQYQNEHVTITFKNKSFRTLEETEGSVQAIVFDLGFSSDQMDASGRGFTFQKNEPLIMTFGKPHTDAPTARITAYDVVNDWSEQSLADIIYGFGEERYARRIANAIITAREKATIESTSDLVEIIRSAVPIFYTRAKSHFATKTFQAIRIAVNDELGALNEGIHKAFAALAPEGRLAVISFHSLEDRIIKRFFQEMVKSGEGTFINKKPIVSSKEEILHNRRARSAKLRIIEKIKK